ncbi:ADP-ribosylglycohydrolase family protein [Conexibacter sp. SYSU D00693]|uniref:ADP-ribosylglycohydrolase family protein n=1 Tax=Conexibacter sp. SYSU D00693 TaxID=2812560 RepID=UPI00196A2AA6|nr:ADP-ribosylglycohydrolase family protein [Conexibacter sp. SYSU D00693]
MRERFRGAMLGLAIGDALGAPLEGARRGSFSVVTGYTEGGAGALRRGEWTADTAMALCLADSLIATKGFDPDDQLARYARWLTDGERSTRDHAFGVGRTTRASIERFVQGERPVTTPDDEGLGNGALMRLAPVVLAYARDRETAVRAAAMQARTTHGNPAAVDPCRYFAVMLHGALHGHGKRDMLEQPGPRHREIWHDEPLEPLTTEVAAGSFRDAKPEAVGSDGLAVNTLEVALWAVHSTDSFRGAVLAAANQGGDADTNAAVAGQLAGALYGEDGIPEEWRAEVFEAEELVRVADALFDLHETLDLEALQATTAPAGVSSAPPTG